MIVHTRDKDVPAEQKASRLRILRASLGLKATEFAEMTDIPTQSIYNWEKSKGSRSISENGANRICQAINSQFKDVNLTTDWLLYGIGNPPSTISNEESSNDTSIVTDNPNESIKKEVELFHNSFEDAVSLTVMGETEDSFFKNGDIVCGINSTKINSPSIFEGKNCIIYSNKGVFTKRVIKIDGVKVIFYITGASGDMLAVNYISLAVICRHYSYIPN